ncbi:unnamed protein product [Clavelina lepadiformis]|uniref:Mitochondrial cardiolipin hydrolase n=1 Tax=Clavelina lepadiformis TaxID=159417 RepID=A0ABP0GS36_CLALP
MLLTGETSLLMYLYSKSRRRRGKAGVLSNTPVFHKVLFFPDKQIPCQKYLLSPKGCTRTKCSYSHDETSSFLQLIRHVLKSQRSIDLCIFSITCNELAHAVLLKYRQGAKVRVITDTEYMNLNGSKIPDFMTEGISVRHDRSSYLMHHKFLILDGNVVVTGSFNWTQSAVIGNNENVLVTNHADVVQPYLDEFDKLWAKFDVEKRG